MAKIFSVLAALGVLITVVFIAGFTYSSFKKNSTKFWLMGLIISALVTLIFYAISFIGIFQLYNLTSQ